MLTSVAIQLVDVLEISTILVWKSASRFGDLRQGQALNRGLRAELNFHSVTNSRSAMPTLLAALTPRFKHLPTHSSCTLATVRYTCVQKGAGAMCAQQRARRTGVFDRPEADQVRSAGARSPCSAGTPFAVTSGHLALF